MQCSIVSFFVLPLVLPVRLSSSEAQLIDSRLLSATITHLTTTDLLSSYSTYTSMRPANRSSSMFTSQNISTERTKAITTSPSNSIETGLTSITIKMNDANSTIPSNIITDSTSIIELTIAESSTKQLEIFTTSNGSTSIRFNETDENTFSIDLITPSDITKDIATSEQLKDKTLSIDETTILQEIANTTLFTDEINVTKRFNGETTSQQVEEMSSSVNGTTISDEFPTISTSEPMEITMLSADKTRELEETTPLRGLVTTSEFYEETTYTTNLPSLTIESSSIETLSVDRDTTNELKQITTSSLLSSMVDYTHQDTLTIDLLENITLNTMESDVRQTTINQEETFTDSSIETPSTSLTNLLESTIAMDDCIEISSSSSSFIDNASTTDGSLISSNPDQSSKFTNDYITTESLFTTDLTLTISNELSINESDTIDSEPITNAAIVSISDMIVASN